MAPSTTAKTKAAQMLKSFNTKRQRGMGWIFSDFILSIIFFELSMFQILN
jgi:hypothetical protein